MFGDYSKVNYQISWLVATKKLKFLKIQVIELHKEAIKESIFFNIKFEHIFMIVLFT